MKLSISSKKTPFLSDKMFGLFFEDINYGADGGLHAEMIENRQFSFRKSWTEPSDNSYHTEYAPDYGWTSVSPSSSSMLNFMAGDSLSEKNPHYMQFSVTENSAAFCNKAYDGICMQEGKSYCLTLWIRNPSYNDTITLTCKSKDNSILAVNEEIKISPSEKWQKIQVRVRASSTIKDGDFIITQNCGTVDYGYISLIPEDAVEGVFRKDLFEMIASMKPGFLRFPGGCIVEGAVLSNRYNWKDTVGLPWERRTNWSRWAVHDFYMGQPGTTPKYCPYYNQTYGIGFYEYFLLSELMGAKPLPVISVGIACQFQSSELCDIKSPEFEEYIQSALDLIEFANGDPSSKWGSVRAEMGHEKPFGLEYIGIGNEQWETDSVDFYARYKAFEKAIHIKYPDMELISTAGPDVTSEKYTSAWNFYSMESPFNTKFTAAVDEHYYMNPQWFYDHIEMYNQYSREVPVFAGEYAAHTEKKENNLEAALAEAAFMTGLERNADVIRFASVAPLFARKNYVQWIPDFIWFDGDTVMGTPGYYVQKMYGNYTGNIYLEHRLDEEHEMLFTSVTTDEKNLYVKVVNSSDKVVQLDEILQSEIPLSLSSAEIYQLGGTSAETVNTLGGDCPVQLKKIMAEDCIKIPAMSCTAIVISLSHNNENSL